VFTDVTVRNSSRHGFSFNAGNTTFVDVTARRNGLGGFEIFDAGDHTLTNVSAVDNGGIGFEFRYLVSNNTFTNVSARGNDDEGFLLEDANRTVLTGVSAADNGAGVVVSESAAVEIDGGAFENNTADGIRLEGAPNTTVRGAEVLNNDRDGLLVANGSDRTLVTGVTARGNARYGVYVTASSRARIVDSRAETNADSGLGVGSAQPGQTATSRNVSFENTTALDNGEHGVEIDDSAADATLIATNASDNRVDGIHADGADGVTMSDTTTLGNGRWGLFMAGASGTYSVDSLATSGGGVSFTARNVAVRDGSTPGTASPSDHVRVGIYVNATPTGPNPFFDVSVSYDQAAVDAAGVNESTLRLWEFDGSTWTPVSRSTVDTGANVVSANVTEFSIFALFGTGHSEPTAIPTPTPAPAPAATDGGGGEQNEPPVAAFEVSTDAPEIGAVVRFDAADSDDPNGVIVAYEWDFDGDGDTDATGESPGVTHTYDTAGTVEVSLTVVDSFGATNTTTRTVEVVTGTGATQTPTPARTVTPTETDTSTPTAAGTDTAASTPTGTSSPAPVTTLFGSSVSWWLLVGVLVAIVALSVARPRRDGRK
jgi:PKD repeat protein